MIVHPTILAARIVTVIEAHSIDTTTESAAHDAIEAVLHEDGLNPQREVWLSRRDRVDLMCGSVAVEIKSARRAGHLTAYNQLLRYAKSDAVQSLVLATGRGFVGPDKMNGKPLFVASLSSGWL